MRRCEIVCASRLPLVPRAGRGRRRGARAFGAEVFLAGAAVVDVSPRTLPVIVNGGFLEAKADTVHDPLSARGLVLDDGATRLAIVVVDSCGLPRELVDVAKERAGSDGNPDRSDAGLGHAHALGPVGDPGPGESRGPRVHQAPARLDRRGDREGRQEPDPGPGRMGFGRRLEHTHCRRWIHRPDKMLTDPFGLRTVRANMHPGYQNPDTVGPAGPVDPELSVLSVQALDGRPIALLANYSMHYFGAGGLGRLLRPFVRLMESQIGAKEGGPPFVAIMSQGTSGDQHWMDYGRPKTDLTMDAYAEAVARRGPSWRTRRSRIANGSRWRWPRPS